MFVVISAFLFRLYIKFAGMFMQWLNFSRSISAVRINYINYSINLRLFQQASEFKKLKNFGNIKSHSL